MRKRLLTFACLAVFVAAPLAADTMCPVLSWEDDELCPGASSCYYKDGVNSYHKEIICGGTWDGTGDAHMVCADGTFDDIKIIEVQNVPDIKYFGATTTRLTIWFCRTGTTDDALTYARKYDANAAYAATGETRAITYGGGSQNGTAQVVAVSCRTAPDPTHYSRRWADSSGAHCLRNCVDYPSCGGGACATRTPDMNNADRNEPAYCDCNDGYHNIGGDKYAACESDCTGVTSCGIHGACQLVTGEATCVCQSGYHRQIPADPLSECVSDCAGIDCGDNGACYLEGAVPQCACDPHYRWDPDPIAGYPYGRCVDECGPDSSYGHIVQCANRGYCETEEDGTPYCDCQPGFRPIVESPGVEPNCVADCYYNPDDPQYPYDPDDPYTPSDYCGEVLGYGYCVADKDSNEVQCVCNDGFRPDGLACVSVCEQNDCGVGDEDACQYVGGEAHCLCPDEYTETFDVRRASAFGHEEWMTPVHEYYYRVPTCRPDAEVERVYYSFDGETFAPVFDLSASPVDDTLYPLGGAVRGDGMWGKGLYLDGDLESYAAARSSSDSNLGGITSFTLSFFWKPVGTPDPGSVIMMKHGQYGIAYGEGGTLSWALMTGDDPEESWQWHATVLAPTPGTWNAVTLTYDGAEVRLYLRADSCGDDPCVLHEALTGEVRYGAEPLTIGLSDGAVPIEGFIDEFRLFALALDDAGEEALAQRWMDDFVDDEFPTESDPCRHVVCPVDKVCSPVDSGGGVIVGECVCDIRSDDQAGICIDQCMGVRCSGHGRCISDYGDIECFCDPGWQGQACEEPRTPTTVCPYGAVDAGFGVCVPDTSLKISYSFSEFRQRTVVDLAALSDADRYNAEIPYDLPDWVTGVTGYGVDFFRHFTITPAKGASHEASAEGLTTGWTAFLWVDATDRTASRKVMPVLRGPEYELAIVRDPTHDHDRLMLTVCAEGWTDEAFTNYNRVPYGSCRSAYYDVPDHFNRFTRRFSGGQWSLFAVVYDGTAVKVYTPMSTLVVGTMDIPLAGVGAGLKKPRGADLALRLGPGGIDEFRFYHRAFSLNELMTAYRTLPCQGETCGEIGACVAGEPVMPQCECFYGYFQDELRAFTCVVEENVTFNDPALEECVREQLRIPDTDPVTNRVARRMTALDCRSRDIFDIGGLEHFVNLLTIDLSDNNLSDIDLLVPFDRLEKLDVSYNCIAEMPIFIAPELTVKGDDKQKLAYCDRTDYCSGFACSECNGHACSAGTRCRADQGKLSCVASCDTVKCGVGQACDDSGEAAQCVASCGNVGCGIYADCVAEGDKARCVCKEGYADAGSGNCTNVCAGVTCGGHGVCRLNDDDLPECLCDEDYRRYSGDGEETCVKACAAGWYEYKKYCIQGYGGADGDGSGATTSGHPYAAEGDPCEIAPQPDCDPNGPDDCACTVQPTLEECFDESYLNTHCGAEHKRCTCSGMIRALDLNANGTIDEGEEMDAVPEPLRDKINGLTESDESKQTLAPTVYSADGVEEHETISGAVPYQEPDMNAPSTGGATMNDLRYADSAAMQNERLAGFDEAAFNDRWNERTADVAIDSCRRYVHQKYGDFLRAAETLVLYQDQPLSRMSRLFDIHFFREWAKNSYSRNWDHLASAAKRDSLRTIERDGGRSLFWRVLYLAYHDETGDCQSGERCAIVHGMTRMTLLDKSNDGMNMAIEQFGSSVSHRDIGIYSRLRNPGDPLFEGTVTDFAERETAHKTMGLLRDNLEAMLLYRANTEMHYAAHVELAAAHGVTLTMPKQSAKAIIEDTYGIDLDAEEDPTEEDLRVRMLVDTHPYLETEEGRILQFKMDNADFEDGDDFAETVLGQIDTRLRKLFIRAATDHSCVMNHSTGTYTDCEWHPDEALEKIMALIEGSDKRMEDDYRQCLLATREEPELFTDDPESITDLGSHTFRVPQAPATLPQEITEENEALCDMAGKDEVYPLPTDLAATLSDPRVVARSYLTSALADRYHWRSIEDYFKIFPRWSADYADRQGKQQRLGRLCAAYLAKKALEMRKRQQEAQRQAARTAAEKMSGMLDMKKRPDPGKALNIEKFFSDYRNYGNGKAGVDFSYILGYAIQNAVIGWNDLQPELYDKIGDNAALKRKIAIEYYRDMVAEYVEKKSLAVSDLQELLEEIEQRDTHFDANIVAVAASFDTCSTDPAGILGRVIAPTREVVNGLTRWDQTKFGDFLDVTGGGVIDRLSYEMLLSLFDDAASSVCNDTGQCPGAVDFAAEMDRTIGNRQIADANLAIIRDWLESRLAGRTAVEWEGDIGDALGSVHDKAGDLRFLLVSDVDAEIDAMRPDLALASLPLDLDGFDVEAGSAGFDASFAQDLADFGDSVDGSMTIAGSYFDGMIETGGAEHRVTADFMQLAAASEIDREATSYDLLAGARAGNELAGCTLPTLDLSYIDTGHATAVIDADTLPRYSYDTVVDGTIDRIKEIAKGRLLTIPQAELIAHVRGGVKVLGHKVELFEMTNYINTLYDEPDLSAANQQAADRFKELAEDNGGTRRLQLYERYYIIDFEWAINLSLNLPPAKIKSGIGLQKKKARDEQKKKLEEIAKANGQDPTGKTREQLLRESMHYTPDFKRITTMEGMDSEIPLAKKVFEKTQTFMIGPVPLLVGFGFSIDLALGIGTDMTFGFDDGFAVGMQVGPVVTSAGFLRAGVGFDLAGLVTVFAGVRGELVFFAGAFPLSVSAVLKPTIENGYPGAYLFLTSELRPRIEILRGRVELFAEARFCFIICKWKRASQELFSFKPLISKTFPNILPISPLKVNLFDLSSVLSDYDEYLHQHE